nr:Probable ATP-dependent RNA helicase DHX35 [Euglena gracilis]
MAFWKPGDSAPKSSAFLDKAASAEGADVFAYNPFASQALDAQRQRLPIFAYRKPILYLLETCRALIVVGEPGCGKTTQIPQYLFEAGWAEGDRVVCCTQPRRVACVSLAQRVAQERGSTVGGLVGYTIRFEDRTSAATRIKYVTDGMLLQEIMGDPLLARYSVIVVDEAHERSLHTDVLLGLLRKVMRRRPALRVVVSSATLQATQFRDFFAAGLPSESDADTIKVGMLSVEGRCFPVDLHYCTHAVSDYLSAAHDLILHLHHHKPRGDVLCFLPGQEDIETLLRMLRESGDSLAPQQRFLALPLFSGLSTAEQLRAFQPSSQRKVILSTNLAETSVTIEGVVYVIDSGLVKVRAYSAKLGLERLVCTSVSRAEAEQRAGRAGRVQSGECYRLFTERWFTEVMPEHPVPAMLRSDLSGLVLQMKLLGVEDLLRFPFPSAPPTASFCKSLELLYCLGAIDDDCRITDVGTAMATLAVEPMLARFILTAAALGLDEEACKAAALLSVRDLWLAGRAQQDKVAFAKSKLCVAEGDHISYMNIFSAWEANGKSKDFCDEMGLNWKAMKRANEIHNHLRRQLKRVKPTTLGLHLDAIRSIATHENPDQQALQQLCACGLAAFFPNAAHRLPDGSYRTVHGGATVHLHGACAFANDPPEWLVFTEVVQQDGKLWICDCLAVRNPLWLVQLAPHFYRYRSPADRLAGGAVQPGGPGAVPQDELDRPSNWLIF